MSGNVGQEVEVRVERSFTDTIHRVRMQKLIEKRKPPAIFIVFIARKYAFGPAKPSEIKFSPGGFLWMQNINHKKCFSITLTSLKKTLYSGSGAEDLHTPPASSGHPSQGDFSFAV